MVAVCASERGIGGLFLLALVVLVVVRGLPAVVRARRVVRNSGGAEWADRLLGLAVSGLPADRREWGSAMRAELAVVTGRRARWRFSLGCARAATALRVRACLTPHDRGGSGVRALALCAIVAALGLAVYELVRYPALRSSFNTWASASFFVVLVLAYTGAVLTLSRGSTAQARVARRYGLAGGLLTGAAWLLILAPAGVVKSLVFVPLLVALVAPLVVAVLAGRASRNAGAATGAALWSGLVGGLLVFIIWVTATYATDGRPYDAQLLRDYRNSGSHDLVAYAVADNLGGALGLLVIIPLVALALGSLGGLIAGARPR
ncbi:MAG: hypothetical protein QOI71_1932 [Gaiellales bacterium]|nr:hypothetical protein [Gaiellales bacterium]